VHHSIIHKETRKRCNSVSKFFYFVFIWSSTCFGGHTAHHQEPKTALAASGFAYVEGCWTCSCWTLLQLHVQQPSTQDIHNLYTYIVGRRSAVSIVTGQSRDQIPVGARFFAPLQTGPGAHPAFYAMGARSFLGVKRPGCDIDNPLPSRLKKE